MSLINKYINDDCFNVLPSIKDRSIDLVFSGIPDMTQIENKVDIEKYIDFIKKSVNEFCRIVTEHGFIIMMQTDRKLNGTIFPKQDYIKKFMADNDLKLYQHKIYVKNKIDKKNLYQLNYCNVLVFTRKGKIKQQNLSSFLQDVFVYEYDSFGTFDSNFVNLVLEVFTEEGDIVLDPFAGSGTVCRVAKFTKRNFIGIEYDKYIYEKYKNDFSGVDLNTIMES